MVVSFSGDGCDTIMKCSKLIKKIFVFLTRVLEKSGLSFANKNHFSAHV